MSQVLTKENHEDFCEEEIFPVETLEYEDEKQVGSYGTLIVTLKNGIKREINFEGIESGLIML